MTNKLRQVKFYKDDTRNEDDIQYGWFHKFSRAANMPVAIIELDNGKIETKWVKLVQFIEPYRENRNERKRI